MPDRGRGRRSRRKSDPFAAGDERGSWNIWAEGCRKMDGGGDHKGDEQAEEEAWESERCGEEGQVEVEGAPWGKQALMQEWNVVGGKG